VCDAEKHLGKPAQDIQIAVANNDEYPDGGFLAWSQVTGGFFLTVNSGWV